MEDPWEELDALDLEEVVFASFKTMQKTLNYFKAKELTDIINIASVMKNKIDEFRPVVPVAVSLRKEGMKDRHWEALSKGIGEETGNPDFKVYPDPGFTLTAAIDLGLTKFTAICEEVGEKAGKEYNIETQLTKMKADWNGVNFLLKQFKQTTTSTISGFDDAMNMLDEHIVCTQAM